MKKSYLLSVLILIVNVCALAQHNSIDRIDIVGSLTSDIMPVSEVVEAYVYRSSIDLSGVDVQKKKQNFINLMLPSILIAKFELEQTRLQVEDLIKKKGALTDLEQKYIDKLQKRYKCKTNSELLSRLLTHPTSIVIAQAAIESGWGTSRFYCEANNIFGVWSYSKSEPRIRASEDREGTAVYVRKYDSLPESIASYFKTLARGPYSEFRNTREKTNDVYELIPHLKVYSELRDEYVRRLEQVIKYNHLVQYDEYTLKMNN
jgi:Bax protein